MTIKTFTLLFFISISATSFSQCKTRSIAFYNVENLFDTLDTPDKNDSEFLPNGKKEWNTNKYNTKIDHINQVFDDLKSPLLIGLCEIENRQVVVDVVNGGSLKGTHSVVHTESLDKRGIDNAIIYDSTVLNLENDGIIRFDIPDSDRPTRDIVWAKFSQDNESFYVMVNHWPSRYGGQEKSDPKRVAAAKAAKKFIDSLISVDPNSQIVLMGDLNDHPDNNGPQLIAEVLHPMITAESGEFGGTHNYRGEWGVLDHIMVSESFKSRGGMRVKKKSGEIHSFDFLIGEYKGNKVPARTYGGGKYLDGYSDHLPVSVQIKL